jgi:hypothetical protein
MNSCGNYIKRKLEADTDQAYQSVGFIAMATGLMFTKR